MDVPCIAKVIGFDKLKRNYKQFKDKRALIKEFDLFVADLRVYKMLPECLGREFYSTKKFPCPLKLHGFANDQDLEKQLNSAAAATFFTMGNGPNYSVKVGATFQKPKDVAANTQSALVDAISAVTVHDDISFDMISQISMKLGDSPELPVYNFFSGQDLASAVGQN